MSATEWREEEAGNQALRVTMSAEREAGFTLDVDRAAGLTLGHTRGPPPTAP
jgi:hypothetical protein